MVRINGQHESEFGMLCISGIVEPPIATIENNLQKVGNRMTLWDFGSKVSTKPIRLSFIIPDTSEVKSRDRIDRFIRLFTDDRGVPKYVKLSMDTDPNVYYNVILESAPSVSRDVSLQTTQMELNVLANPGQKFSVVNNDEVLWGSEELMFQGHSYHMGDDSGDAEFKTTGGNVNVTVKGLSMKPEIVIKGSATNLVISNKGHDVAVGTFTNTTWIIDTHNFIAYRNGVETIIPIAHDWYLDNGLNTIQFKGTGINLDVTIRYRDRWS